MQSRSVVVTLAALKDAWPDLTDVTIVGLDLSAEELNWSEARLDGATLLGCLLPEGATDRLVALGAAVFPEPRGLPFEVYRSALYSYEELAEGSDERIAAWFASS